MIIKPRIARRASIEYMCTYCGRKEIRTWNAGRPQPGICPQRGGKLPHRWVQNRIDRG